MAPQARGFGKTNLYKMSITHRTKKGVINSQLGIKIGHAESRTHKVDGVASRHGCRLLVSPVTKLAEGWQGWLS